MEKCAQSTLQLPSELVVACGNSTLRHEHRATGSPCSLSGFTLRGAMLGTALDTCYPAVLGWFSL